MTTTRPTHRKCTDCGGCLDHSECRILKRGGCRCTAPGYAGSDAEVRDARREDARHTRKPGLDAPETTVTVSEAMRLGTQTGSLVNHIMSSTGRWTTPVLGMGATILGWTDRYPATVIGVEEDKHGAITLVAVQEDDATRTDAHGMSEVQAYTYSPNPQGRVWQYRNVGGTWRQLVEHPVTGKPRLARKGQSLGLVLGQREKYHDFSF